MQPTSTSKVVVFFLVQIICQMNESETGDRTDSFNQTIDNCIIRL